MKTQEIPSTNEPALDTGIRRSRESWSTALLIAAVLLYGAAAIALMSMRMSGALGLWVLGAVMGLVALGFLVGTIPTSLQPSSSNQTLRLPDTWAEEWEELFQRPVH